VIWAMIIGSFSAVWWEDLVEPWLLT